MFDEKMNLAWKLYVDKQLYQKRLLLEFVQQPPSNTLRMPRNFFKKRKIFNRFYPEPAVSWGVTNFFTMG